MSPNEIKKINETYEDGIFCLVMNELAEEEEQALLEESAELNEFPFGEQIKRFKSLLGEIRGRNAAAPRGS